MKSVSLSSFTVSAVMLALMFSGCAQKDNIEPTVSTETTVGAESVESKQEITKLFSGKLGFLNRELRENDDKKLLEYGYEFFKKEN